MKTIREIANFLKTDIEKACEKIGYKFVEFEIHEPIDNDDIGIISAGVAGAPIVEDLDENDKALLSVGHDFIERIRNEFGVSVIVAFCVVND